MRPEQNKAVMRRFTGFINTASEDLAAELVSPKMIFYVPGRSEPIEVKAMNFYRFSDGQIVEEHGQHCPTNGKWRESCKG